MSGYDYVSALTGCTTEVQGRFAISGPAFELLADGSVASGGPGRAPGPLDLLVSALVANLLNVLRSRDESGIPQLDQERDVEGERVVQVRARTTRYAPGRLKVGRLTVEVLVDGADAAGTAELLEAYRDGCRVLPAVETVLDVELRAASVDEAVLGRQVEEAIA